MNLVTTIGLIVTTLSIIGIVYPHFLYPLLLKVIRTFRGRPIQSIGYRVPSVQIAVSCYNEETRIEACIRSIMSNDYPRDSFSVVVGDDGSSDATVSVVENLIQEFGADRLSLLLMPRSGKNAVMNAITKTFTAPIIVFTDADTVWESSAIRILVKPFASASVGAVVGRNAEFVVDNPRDAGSQGENMHRRFENIVNRLESEIASTVWSNGPLYAIRREFSTPLPNGKVADDWFHLLHVISCRRRVLFEPRAVVTEQRENSLRAEVNRTVRTAASGMSTLLFHRKMLLLSSGWNAFFLVSHRVVRWASPFFLITAMIGTAMMVSDPLLFGIAFYSQFAVYSLALLGFAADRYGQVIPIAGTCAFFVGMSFSFLRAAKSVFSSQSHDYWDPNGDRV